MAREDDGAPFDDHGSRSSSQPEGAAVGGELKGCWANPPLAEWILEESNDDMAVEEQDSGSLSRACRSRRSVSNQVEPHQTGTGEGHV